MNKALKKLLIFSFIVAGVFIANSFIMADYAPTRGMTNPMTAIGDMIFGSTAGNPTRLPIGTSTQVLTVSATGTPVWATPSGGGAPTTTINGASGPNFTFSTGSTGSDFNLSTSTGAISFNLPSATSTVRGLLTSADWTNFNSKEPALGNPAGNGYQLVSTISGARSWVAPGAATIAIGGTITSGTAGSVLYAGASNVLAQDNANFFYDYTNHRLALATSSATHTLTLGSNSTGEAFYNTADQTTNYERVLASWGSNVFSLTPQKGGTGTVRGIQLGTSARYFKADSNASTQNYFATDATGNSLAGFTGTFNASTGNQNIFYITPTLTQSGSAGYNALLINPTETSVGTGTKMLINAQIAGAAKFNVNDIGDIFTNNFSSVQKTDGKGNIVTINAPLADPQEATMATVLNSGGGNKEWVDWTMENYGGVDHQASINIAKSGTGTITPFAIRQWDSDLGAVSTYGITRFQIAANGNIGIGTTTPANNLQVYNASSSQALFNGYSSLASSAASANGSILVGGNSSYQGILDFSQSGNTTLTLKNSFNNSGSAINFDLYNTHAMTLLGSGNIGIGTTTPSTKLFVVGTTTATAFIKTGGTSAQFLKANGTVDSSTYLTSASLSGYVPFSGTPPGYADLDLGYNSFKGLNLTLNRGGWVTNSDQILMQQYSLNTGITHLGNYGQETKLGYNLSYDGTGENYSPDYSSENGSEWNVGGTNYALENVVYPVGAYNQSENYNLDYSGNSWQSGYSLNQGINGSVYVTNNQSYSLPDSTWQPLDTLNGARGVNTGQNFGNAEIDIQRDGTYLANFSGSFNPDQACTMEFQVWVNGNPVNDPQVGTIKNFINPYSWETVSFTAHLYRLRAGDVVQVMFFQIGAGTTVNYDEKYLNFNLSYLGSQ